MRFTRRLLWFAPLVLLLGSSQIFAAPIGNTATGSTDGNPLNATVSLNRVGGVASQVLAEITPNEVQVNTPGNPLTYSILPTIDPGDTGIERVEITTPAGYTNVTITSVSVGGTTLIANCPTPGAGQYCATGAGSSMTVLLGDKVTTTLTEIRIDCVADAPPLPGSADFTSTVADGPVSMPTIVGDANGNPADANSITVEVLQTQGLVLQLAKVSGKSQALSDNSIVSSVL